MFYLFTGQPGSKKTANMIHFVLTDSQFNNRPVYFFNIKECKVENWVELSEDQVKDWPNVVPEGGVLLIDEGQEIWRPAAWDKTPPLHVTGLEKHRHQGIDIVATTQHPMLIHTAVRRQVQQHRHLKAAYGLKSTARVWEKCVNDPDDHFAKQEAETLSANVPKSVFNLYKSTALNTHKRRIPKKLYFVVAALLGVLYLTFTLYTSYAGKSEPEAVLPETKPALENVVQQGTGLIKTALGTAQQVPVDNESYKPRYPVNKKEYLALFKPRIEGLPATAPIYDELQKPVEAPRVFCVRLHTKSDGAQCRCYTQQATKVVNPNCDSMIDNGLFDPTLASTKKLKPRAQTAEYNEHGEQINKPKGAY